LILCSLISISTSVALALLEQGCPVGFGSLIKIKGWNSRVDVLEEIGERFNVGRKVSRVLWRIATDAIRPSGRMLGALIKSPRPTPTPVMARKYAMGR
jgi:hypothetical protein